MASVAFVLVFMLHFSFPLNLRLDWPARAAVESGQRSGSCGTALSLSIDRCSSTARLLVAGIKYRVVKGKYASRIHLAFQDLQGFAFWTDSVNVNRVAKQICLCKRIEIATRLLNV